MHIAYVLYGDCGALVRRDPERHRLYVAVRDGRVIVVRAFIKKTRKTPHSEVRLALQRAREVLQ